MSADTTIRKFGRALRRRPLVGRVLPPRLRRKVLSGALRRHRGEPGHAEREGELLRAALFQIAELALSSPDLDQLYKSIHQIVGQLMDATNFYIALYDEKTDRLSFPYFVDELDPKPEGTAPGKTLTGRVLRSGKPLLATEEAFRELMAEGVVEQVGAPSVDWLGVPLQIGDHTFGVLGVQSYDRSVRYTQRDVDILMFVSQHVAGAIEATRKEDALRESERRYRQLFENNRAIKLIIDPVSGRILQANQAAADFYGYPVSKLETMLISDINILSKPDIESAMNRAVSKAETTFLFQHRLASGEIRDVEVHSGAVEMYGRQVLYSIVQDVSERVRAERKLRRSEEHFRELIENTSDLITVIDAQGIIHYASPSVRRVLGYRPAKTLGRSIYPFVADEDVTQLRSDIERALQEHDPSPMTFVFRLKHADGSFRTLEGVSRRIEEPGDPVPKLVVTCRDVTERKRAEEAIWRSEAKYRSIFDYAPVGIYQSTVDGRFISANATLARILGYNSVDELLDLNLQNDVYFEALDRPELIARHAPGGAAAEIEVLWKKKDGTPIWVQLNAHAVKDPEARVLRFEGFVVDITERKRAEATMRTQATAMESATDGIALLDPNHRINYANRALARLHGFRGSADLIGRNWSVLYEPAEYKTFLDTIFPAVAEYGEWRGQAVGRKRNGPSIQQEITVTALDDAGLICVVRDITDRTHAEEQIRHLAYHDALTSLPNRLLLKDRLSVAIARAQRHRSRLAVLFLDIDRFKVINDSLGHNIGDLLLQEVARRLQYCVRDSDTVARLGGDEFTILLSEIKNLDDAPRIADKILAAVRVPFQIDGRELYVSTSIGISVYPEDGLDAETLIKNADTAMYQAKETGRNRHQIFNALASAQALERLALEHGLRKALANDELIMHYQPIFDLRSGRIVAMEALLRWNHPELGLILPSDFVSLAETTGIMVPIGNWALRTACKEARRWEDLGFTGMSLAVNISAIQLQPGLPDRVSDALIESRWPPNRLELEITESGAMQYPEHSIEMLERLNALGVSLALDDFGTGHSSLSYLRQLPIDTLKIDQSFVREISTSEDTASIVSAIIAIGHKLRLTVTAEGVENESQRVYLLENGCDQVQGYLLRRPLAPEDIEEFFTEHNAKTSQWTRRR